MDATQGPHDAPGPSLVHVGLLLASFVLLIVAFSGTWASWTLTEPDEEITFSFSRSDLELAGEGRTQTFSYDAPIGPLGSMDNVESTFDWTTALLIIATIAVIVAALLHAAPMAGVVLPVEHARIARWTVIAAASLALLAPVQVWLGFPGAVDADLGGTFSPGSSCEDDAPTDSFWGSCSDGDSELSWGGSTAWFATLAAGLCSGATLFVPWQGEPMSPKDVERMTVEVRMASGFDG